MVKDLKYSDSLRLSLPHRQRKRPFVPAARPFRYGTLIEQGAGFNLLRYSFSPVILKKPLKGGDVERWDDLCFAIPSM
jgi:hypothetical protein